MLAFRLSGYPAAVEVSAKAALRNGAGLAALSAAKVATPGAAADPAPSLWGDIAHGAEVSENSLNVGAWTLDNATEEAVAADSPYTAPRRVIATLHYGRKNTTTSVLAVGVGYPFAVTFKAGTSNAARIVIRAPSGGEIRLLTTGFGSVTVSTSTTVIGAVSGVFIAALANGFYRMWGVFTPAISSIYSFGSGPNPPNGGVTPLDFVLYGGAMAEPEAGPPPDPDPEGPPPPFAPEQWELLDAATDGATLIIRVHEIPLANPVVYQFGYRLNGSPTTIGLTAAAPGDYAIAVPALTEAAVLLRSINALDGASSDTKFRTPTAAPVVDPSPADLYVASNDFLDLRDYFDVDSPTTVMTHLAGNVLSADGFGNSYQIAGGTGGAIVYTNGRGDFKFHPNGAYDNLNAGQTVDVDITWRKTGDVADRTLTIQVEGSAETGADLARDVTPSTAMTLTSALVEGEVLEVAFTAGGASCRPSLGGEEGVTTPAGKRAVQYIHCPAGGSAALAFTSTPAAVHARIVETPGEAASIRRLRASRSGSTLTLKWGVTPKAGLPATAGFTEYANITYSSPTLDCITAFVNTVRIYSHDNTFNNIRRAHRLDGHSGFVALDNEGVGAHSTAAGSFGYGFQLTQGDALELGPTYIYDCQYDRSTTGSPDGASKVNSDIIDKDHRTEIDAATVNQRPDRDDFYVLGGDFRNVGDAPFDMKASWWGNMITVGGSWRHFRQWTGSGVVSRVKSDVAPVNLYMQTCLRGGFLDFFMWELADGSRFHDFNDASRTIGVSAFWTAPKIADGRPAGENFHFIARKAKPKLPPEVDVAATHFEFQQSVNGGATYSALSVARTGPNDCWGGTRRTVSGVSTSITHVRCRARWGVKNGEWTVAAVTT